MNKTTTLPETIKAPRNIDDILSKLTNVKPAGANKWTADCPASGHSTPKKHLSIEDTGDKALVACHPGPHTYKDICKALGFDSLNYRTNGHRHKETLDIEAIYNYIDANGKPFEVVRYKPKAFKQRRPDGHGGYIYNLNGIIPTLYHQADLPGAAASQSIYLVEGEKDVDTLWNYGLIATCNPMGAGKWKHPEYTEVLKGADVVIICDNDRPGREHGKLVAGYLYGIARRVRLIRKLPAHDVTDWFNAGACDSDLSELVALTPEYYPEKVIWQHDELLKQVFEPINWRVDGLIVDEGLTVLGGKKKRGKSWLLLQIAQAVAAGVPTLGRNTKQTSVILYALEDGQRRLRGRLEQQSAQAGTPITYIFELEPLESGGLDQIRDQVEQFGAGMVIIDTLAAAKTGKTDENSAGYMADMGNSLRKLAQELKIAVAVAAHHKKLAAGDPGDDIRGSSAIAAAADINLGLYKTEEIHLLKAEGRDIEETELRVEFDANSTWCWQLLGDARQIARDEAEAEIIDAIDELGRCDAGEIAKLTGKARPTINTSLKRMRIEGKVNFSHDESNKTRILYENIKKPPIPPIYTTGDTPPTPPTTPTGSGGV